MSSFVAVIGMGQMGSGMARRLMDSGYDVQGYDISTRTRQALRNEGFQVAETIAEAVTGRGVILTSLPDPAAVRAAWLGHGGIVEHAARDSLIIELSTIDPDTMKDVGKVAADKGIEVIDCPVSGSPDEASEGKLVLMVGGEPAAIDRGRPILDLLGPTWRETGPVGTAKVVKLVNNMMSMGNVLVAAEAFALGTAAGVEPEKLFDVLSVSGGRSHHFLKRFPKALEGNYAPGFKMELGEKDLALAIEFSRTMRQPTPAASAVREMMAIALAEGYRGQDIVALHNMYRRWSTKKEV